jgi:hypothetical protein
MSSSPDFTSSRRKIEGLPSDGGRTLATLDGTLAKITARLETLEGAKPKAANGRG